MSRLTPRFAAVVRREGPLRPQMLKNVGLGFLATLLGLVVGSAFNMALVVLNAFVLFPMPEGSDFNNPSQVAEWAKTLPTAAYLVVMVAHLGQAFLGGWVAARFAPAKPMIPALVVGSLSLLGGVLNMLQIPGPVWMWAEVPLYLLLAWAAGRMVEASRGAASADR